MIPTLTTKRLHLRAPRPTDFDGYKDVRMGPRAKYLGGGPCALPDAYRAFAAAAGAWILHGHGGWAIEETDTGDFCGIVDITQPPHFPEIELGWVLVEAAEGRGIAFEAATAARDWAFTERKVPTLVSYIDGDNLRSIALAERLGAVRDDGADRPDPEDIVYRHSAPSDLLAEVRA